MDSLSQVVSSFQALSLHGKGVEESIEQAQDVVLSNSSCMAKKSLVFRFHNGRRIRCFIQKSKPSFPFIDGTSTYTKVRSLFSNNSCFYHRFHSTSSEFFTSIPKNLFWSISDISELRDVIQLRPWNKEECYQIKILKNPSYDCHFLVEVRDHSTEKMVNFVFPFLKVSFHRDKSVSMEGIESYSVLKVVEILKKFKSLLSPQILDYIKEPDDLPVDVPEQVIPCTAPEVNYDSGELRVFRVDDATFRDSLSNADEFFDIDLGCVSDSAQSQACFFLSIISVAEMQWILKSLDKHSKIQTAYNKLEDMLSLIAEQQGAISTLKDIEDELVKLKDLEDSGHKFGYDVNTLLKNFCEIFKGHKKSIFTSLAFEELKKKEISNLSLLIVSEILEEIPIIDVSVDIRCMEKKHSDSSKELELDLQNLQAIDRSLKFLKIYSTQDHISILYDIFVGEKSVRENLKWLYKRTIKQRIKNPEIGLRKSWRQQSFNDGIELYISVVLSSLNWLARLKISEFKYIAPGFSRIDLWEKLPKLTFMKLIEQLQRDEAEDYIKEVLAHFRVLSPKIIEELLDSYINKNEKFDPSELYFLWKFAKIKANSDELAI